MGCSGSFDARLQPGFSGIYVCHALFREQADYLRGESGEDVAEQADVIFFHCRKVCMTLSWQVSAICSSSRSISLFSEKSVIIRFTS